MATGISRDKLVALMGLSAANFVVGMGAFMVVGMITPIATAFGTDAAAAGWTMTIYAIVYAVASPLMVASVGTTDRRLVVMAGLVLFMAGSALSAMATSFELLLVTRALMALGAGIVTPVAASIGVVMSPPEKRGFALSLVHGGMTLAQVFGVPVGAWLAYSLGWQAAFMVVSVLAGLALVLLGLVCPRGILVPPTRLPAIGTALATPRLFIAIAFTMLLMSSSYMVYTYLAPLFEARHGLGRNGVTMMLVILGLGAVAGNILGGRLTDRIGPIRTLMMICLAQAALLPAITLLTLPLWAMVMLVLAWSVCTWCFMVPQQARLASLDFELTPVLLALNAAATYVGASVGSALGGQIFRHLDLGALGIFAAVISLVALGSLFLFKGDAPSRP